MVERKLMADARAKRDDWLAWVGFFTKVWNYFKDKDTFTGADVDWFIDTLVRTFQVPNPVQWDLLGDQVAIIIDFVIANRDDMSWSNIMTFMMLVIGLMEYIGSL